MTDEINTPEQPQELQYTPEQVKAMADELDRLKKHQETLLGETKTAKQRAKELEEAQAAAVLPTLSQ